MESINLLIPSSEIFSGTKNDISMPMNQNYFEPKLNENYSIKPPLQKEFSDGGNIHNSLTNKNSGIELQKQLAYATKEDIDNIIKKLKGTFHEIIKDKNGNFFFTDLIKACDKDQRFIILQELSPVISSLCSDKYANHAIQTLIEYTREEEEYILLLQSFNDYNNTMFACLDPYGSYVIQKIITHVPEKNRKDFNSLFIQFIDFISTKKFGVCNTKKFISQTKNEVYVKKIIKTIEKSFYSLAINEYGNFLIQYLMEKWWNLEDFQGVKKIISDNFNILKGNKYSNFICSFYNKLLSKEKMKNNNNDNKNNNNKNNMYVFNQLPLTFNKTNFNFNKFK